MPDDPYPKYTGASQCHECGGTPHIYFSRRPSKGIDSLMEGYSTNYPESLVVFCESCVGKSGILVSHIDDWFDDWSEITREEAVLLHIIGG